MKTLRKILAAILVLFGFDFGSPQEVAFARNFKKKLLRHDRLKHHFYGDHIYFLSILMLELSNWCFGWRTDSFLIGLPVVFVIAFIREFRQGLKHNSDPEKYGQAEFLDVIYTIEGPVLIFVLLQMFLT